MTLQIITLGLLILLSFSIFYMIKFKVPQWNDIGVGLSTKIIQDDVERLDHCIRSLKGQTNSFEEAFNALFNENEKLKEQFNLIIEQMAKVPPQTNASLSIWYDELIVTLNKIMPLRFGPLQELRSEPDDWIRRVRTGTSMSAIEAHEMKQAYEAYQKRKNTGIDDAAGESWKETK